MIGIYKWTSPTGKNYIGQSVDLERRKKEFTINPFTYSYTAENSAIDKARRKYNDFNKWNYSVLKITTKEELDKWEIYYIKEYNSTDSKYGYNATTGGKGIRNYKGIYKKRQRRSYKGSNNPNYGKHHTQEVRQKLSSIHTGKKLSLETKIKLSKPINQYTKDGIFIKTWYSAAEVQRCLLIDKSSICRVCKNKKKTAGGFIWKYTD